ncbi:nurim-like [Dysidea avara]|uniref:nurim-like n=1 Tax=Dysidea avara TaxID=196820 RepID=UPI003321AA40
MEESEDPLRRRSPTSLTDRLLLGFALLLVPILYILVIYSLLTFVWSATISPLGLNLLLFPRLASSSYVTDDTPVYFLARNVTLLILFAVFHTGMASKMYKKLFKQLGMMPFCRTSYVLVTCTIIQVISMYWRPILSYYLWNIGDSDLVVLLMGIVHCLAWLQMVCSLFHLDHLELFGIKQLYYMLWLSQDEPIKFKAAEQQRLFNNARHPLLIGPLLVLWLVPIMSADRLLVAILLPVYQIWGNRVTQADCGYVRIQYQKKVTELRTGTVFHQS